MRGALLALALCACACGGERGSNARPVDREVASISVSYPGASAAVIEQAVLSPIEEALGPLAGVQAMTGRADEGHALIVVELDRPATLDGVVAALARIQPQLPSDSELPVVRRVDGPPALWLAVTGSGDPPAADVSEVAGVIQDRLQRLAGIAAIDVTGTVERIVAVRPDLVRLAAAGLSLTELAAALRTSASDVPVGRIVSRDVTLRVEASVQDVGTLAQTIVGQREGAPIRLGDVALVEEALAPPGTRSAPILGVRLQRGVRSREVLARVRKELAQLAAELSPATRITEVAAPPSTARPAAPLVVTVRGPDLERLAASLDELEHAVRAAGATDLVRDPPAPSPSLTLVPDRERAAQLGVSLGEVVATLRLLVDGVDVGTVEDGGRRRAIRLRVTADRAELPDLLAGAHVRGGGGELVPLSAIATTTTETTQPIVHRDGARAMTLSVHAAGAVLAKARSLARAHVVPASYRVTFDP